MNDDEIRELLHRVDDHPVTNPDLLPAARARLRRRRGAALGAVTALTLVGGTYLATAPGPSDVVAAAPSPSSTPSASQAPRELSALSKAEIERRCAPQLEAYRALPHYVDKGRPWRVVHDFEYHVGDIVGLQSQPSMPAYCVIPEAGQESKAVSLDEFAPRADDPAQLLQLCTEANAYRPSTSIHKRDVPLVSSGVDLRDGTVVSVAHDGPGVVQVLIRDDKDLWSCTAVPPTWDWAGSRVAMATEAKAEVSLEAMGTGAAHKSIVPGDAGYHMGAGRLPANAARIELSSNGTVVREVEVTDGLWNVVVRTPGQLTHLDWRVLDATGREIARGQGA